VLRRGGGDETGEQGGQGANGRVDLPLRRV